MHLVNCILQFLHLASTGLIVSNWPTVMWGCVCYAWGWGGKKTKTTKLDGPLDGSPAWFSLLKAQYTRKTSFFSKAQLSLPAKCPF